MLKEQNYIIHAVEQTSNAVLLNEIFELISSESKVAFILGNEVDGVSDLALIMADRVIEIPQFGTKHSLNVSVTAGIVVWEWIKKHKL